LYKRKKKKILTQLLMAIILATQEAEIGRFMVQGQPRQKVSKTPPQPTSQAWWCMPLIPAIQETQIG
jgi:hypothetical protein